MRRICCFCERWASGGIESFLCNVLSRMDLKRFQVDIVSARKEESVFTSVLEDVGIHFYELSGSLGKVQENHRLFRRLLEERAYDVLHLNAFQGLSLSYLHIAKKSGVPIRIAHSHNTSLRKSATRPLKMAVHSITKEVYSEDATQLWACSEGAAEFLFSHQVLLKRGYSFIPNGIDTQRFRFNPCVRNSVRKELNLEGKLVVGNIGRLCYQKNQDFLLDVFAETLTRNSESLLLLVGEGEDKRTLVQKAESLGISDKVLFYGLTERAEHLLWAMDVFVLPSRFEGLPVTGVEAQAAGLPCIFSDAVPEDCKLTDGTRFLPLCKQPAVWAEAIIQMAVQSDRIAAFDMVRAAGFDSETVAMQIESAYMGHNQDHVCAKSLAGGFTHSPQYERHSEKNQAENTTL